MNWFAYGFGQLCKWLLIAFLALMAWAAWGSPVESNRVGFGLDNPRHV